MTDFSQRTPGPLEALMQYAQADEAGVMVLASRQAIHEVAGLVEHITAERDMLKTALMLALEYWAHRQQRYKNRHPVWVQQARAALAKLTPQQIIEGTKK